MTTYAQLEAESWWGREIVTPELAWLGDELCRRTGRPRTAAGSKGNNLHLRGAHRSQEWILHSAYCTSRTYTVQSGLTSTQSRHIAGFDFTPGSAEQMIAQSKRLMAAVKSGQLEEVRELYGNVDGDQVVDGWDNLHNRAATSDSSHLWHWHLTLDRRHCADRALMERILAVALGEDDDVSATDVWDGTRWVGSDGKTTYTAGSWLRMANTYAARAWEEAKAVRAGQAAILAAVQGLDTDAVLARIDQVAAAETQRDVELRTLVERGLSGELTAEQVVEQLAARLQG